MKRYQAAVPSNPKSAMQAWFLTTKCVQTALSYDCRLVPPTALAVTAAVVAQEAGRTIQACRGLDLNAAKYEGDGEGTQLPWERARLPGMFGGIGAVNATFGAHAQAAYVAVWATRSVAAC